MAAQPTSPPKRGKELRLIKASIAERYLIEQPQIGPGITRWIRGAAEQFDVEEETVRRVIADEREMAALTMRGLVLTRAEEMAALTGARVSRAFEVLAEGMEATREHVVKDSHGNIQLYPEGHEKAGEPIVHSSADFAERRKSADLLLKATIGYAPVKHELEAHHVHETLTDVELKKQLVAATERVRKLLDSGTPVGTGATRAARSRGEGPAGDPRPLVLVDGVYTDQGRAGHSESVQAVPAEGVSPARPEAAAD